jgi:hypothetical protein
MPARDEILAVCGKTFLRFPNGLVDSGLFAFCTLLVHAQVSKSGAEREFFSKLLEIIEQHRAALQRSNRAEQDAAALRLTHCMPTSLHGCAGLLNYVVETSEEDFPDMADGAPFIRAVIRNVAKGIEYRRRRLMATD